jgi:glucose-6-phosphate isomerase
LHSVEDRWGIVALDACLDDAQSADLIRGLFLYVWDALQSTATADEEARLVAVGGLRRSPLLELAQKIGLDAIVLESAFRFSTSASFFEPPVLLVASIMGIDIVNLLRGAAAMTERFATQPVGANPAIDFAGLQRLLAQRGIICGWRIASSASALEPLAQRLHAARDGDHLLIQWTVENPRHDRLQISLPSGKTLEGRPKKMDRPLTEVAHEQFAAARSTRATAGQPTAVVRLPTIDEASIGQLIQMFSLTSAVKQMLDGKVIPTPDSLSPDP